MTAVPNGVSCRGVVSVPVMIMLLGSINERRDSWVVERNMSDMLSVKEAYQKAWHDQWASGTFDQENDAVIMAVRTVD